MLLDTSGLICLLYRTEPFHDRAVDCYTNATSVITHNLILAEFVALAGIRRLSRTACLRFIQDVTANKRIQLEWVNEARHGKGIALLLARPDKDYSLCDAISFTLMRECRISEALTTDHHFEQEGFKRLLV